MSACERKARYETRGEAMRVLRSIKRQLGGNQRPYRCTDCDGWHTTSMSKALLRAVRATRPVPGLAAAAPAPVEDAK